VKETNMVFTFAQTIHLKPLLFKVWMANLGKRFESSKKERKKI